MPRPGGLAAFYGYHSGILLYLNSWNTFTRITDILMNIGSAVFPLILFLANVELTVSASAGTGAVETFASVASILTQIARVGLVVLTGALVISGLYKGLKMVRKAF